MAIDEVELHRRLAGAIGDEAATALLNRLPTVPWTELATKADLARLEERFEVRFESLEAKMDSKFEAMDLKLESLDHKIEARLERRLNDQTRTLITAIGGLLAAYTVAIAGVGAIVVNSVR
jgi:hypothetical protein